MRVTTLLTLLVLAAGGASAQRHKLSSINAETPEGQQLQAIGAEQDAAKKLALMDQFVTAHPKHDGAGWVLTELQRGYAKASGHDKAIEAGEKLLALDGTDIDAAYANLKAAEGKKDSEAVAKWAGVTADIAAKVPSLPKREDESEEDRKHAIDFASQVVKYTEYALYASALQENDPAKVMKLAETLEQRNAQSEYIPQIMPKYAVAARQANALPAAVTFGDRALERGQANEDLLLLMADQSMQQKNADKVAAYSAKILELMASKPKPEGMGEADWEKKKATTTALAHWMNGMASATASRWSQADKSLRAALPLIKDNDQLLAPALFHLGVANYNMGKGKSRQQMTDAVAFLKQCAAMKSAYQASAQKNVAAIVNETGGAAR